MWKYNANVRPILKWAGGKRQLLPDILPIIEQHRISTYVEPFVGGGAILFGLQPQNAVINDYNVELMNLYYVIKEEPQQLLAVLKNHRANHSEEYYYFVRDMDLKDTFEMLSPVEKAARIVYLNKTCFNGLYRVNSKGHFNVPYGRYTNPDIVSEAKILAISDYFNNNKIQIVCGDYKAVMHKARKGQFVYLDPPYMPVSETAAFTSYTDHGFGLKDQQELKEECDRLKSKGIPFLESNSDTPFIRELYKDYDVHVVQAKRYINSKGTPRGEVNEVLIYYGGEGKEK